MPEGEKKLYKYKKKIINIIKQQDLPCFTLISVP